MEENFSITKELQEYGQNVDLESLSKFETLLKSDDLKDIDYKIATLNRILIMIMDNLKQSVKLCSLMDPKYYGEFIPVIKK